MQIKEVAQRADTVLDAGPIRPPALSPELWARFRRAEFRDEWARAGIGLFPSNVGAIAALNDMLEHPDPRRITRAWIDDIRDAAEFIEGGHGGRPMPEHRRPWVARLRGYADALESYLPPK